ncbi:MAG TPA: NAD+ synthase, partial [Methylophilaceae bacterium]|nr:NAD+ synthase [Methylophilaceae bacterium]
MKLAIAQINCTVGDLQGNSARILQAVQQAKQKGASLLVTPELALSGYPPEDLLLRSDFNFACDKALKHLAEQVGDITVVVGHPGSYMGDHYNMASVLRNGQILASYRKHVLPNHSVFDEERYFVAGDEALVFTHEGVRFGVLICADVWESSPIQVAIQGGAEVLLALNASPFHINKQMARHEVLRARVKEAGRPIIYTNLVGGQDELVFDGASFVLDGEGNLMQQLPAFREQVAIVELDQGVPQADEIVPVEGIEASIYQALCLGLRDYIGKNGFPGVVLGLSGGIDSALTAVIAADALGPEKVRTVMMPSEFTADMSIEDARALAENLGIQLDVLPIQPLFQAFQTTLTTEFAGLPPDATEENIQARIRGILLMALSNKFGSIVLTTGNKSEMAVGYATLYGDMAGGFSVLKDVPKTLVYRLSRYRNAISPVIPERIITRAPSAELRANQTDQDSLPPYEILDPIIEAYVELDC